MAEWLIFEDLEQAKKVLLEGETRLVKIGTKKICLIRRNNAFHAFDDECTHLGALLHKGKTNFQNEIVCPWHSYKFNFITGEVSDEKNCPNLKVYRLTERKGSLYLEL